MHDHSNHSNRCRILADVHHSCHFEVVTADVPDALQNDETDDGERTRNQLVTTEDGVLPLGRTLDVGLGVEWSAVGGMRQWNHESCCDAFK